MTVSEFLKKFLFLQRGCWYGSGNFKKYEMFEQ